MQQVIKTIKDCVASKTCCEETGVDCNQGRACPVREGTHKPAEAAHQIQEPAAAVSSGWKIVPVEPTPQMVEAGATERITPHITAGHGAIAVFKAMLEHAPECPALAAPAPVLVAQPQLHAALFAARGALQHMKEGGKPTQSLLNEAIAAIDSVAVPQAAPEAVAVSDERDAFDEWVIKEYPSIRLDRKGDGYRYALVEEWWTVWKARAALAATPADHVADAGKMVLPEPDAWLAVYEDREGNSKFYTSTHKDLAVENDTNGKPQPLYTEQQVRALLATGGQAQAAMNQASEAMKLALSSHGLTLTSYPPQDAWITRDVSGKLSAAITAIAAAKGE